MAGLAMVAMVGALAMVVDAGMFFIIDNQLQSAADAGALAGVWVGPPCKPFIEPGPPVVTHGCTDGLQPDTDAIARKYVEANLGLAEGLCAGPDGQTALVSEQYGPGQILVTPKLSVYSVTVDCQARHWFARIFPGLPLSVHISKSAAATIGYPDRSGPHDVTNVRDPGDPPNQQLVARLYLT